MNEFTKTQNAHLARLLDTLDHQLREDIVATLSQSGDQRYINLAGMVQMGVLDPRKVTRTALQNAASIAGLILTTDCMIAQQPEETRTGAPAVGDMNM